jgi:Cu+-exporting ATPase
MTATVTSTSNQRRLEFEVSGMTCGSCAARVAGTLEGQPGVAGATVNLATGRATVEIDAAGPTNEDDLAAAVEKLGYHLSPFEPQRQHLEQKEETEKARWLARRGRAA